MKITIEENRRGLLVRNGRVVAWLEPGRYRRWAAWAELRVETIDLDTPVSAYRPEVARVAPTSAWHELAVGPAELAVIAVDGLPKAPLRPGRYMLWQVRAEVTAAVYDLRALVPEVPEPEWRWVPSDLGQVVTVAPWESVLVYEDGRLARTLESGRWLVSRLDRDLDLVRVNRRERELTATGQEMMTADKVSLRLNIRLKLRVVDPVASVETVTALDDALYAEAQMAARRTVAGLSLDQLLEGRRTAAEAMTAEVRDRALPWGVEVLAVDVKDVVLPGDMKNLLNQVIEAEKAAAAQVIRRREETAATRSRANTAKMLEASPTLMRLEELEAMKEIAASIDQLTLVAGSGELVDRLLARPTPGRGGG